MSVEPREISIALIDQNDRLRPVDPEKVAELRVSFRERGQMQPIEVREIAGGRFKLVFGAHRLEAAREEGWKAIHATVFEGNDDEARLREIDENLYRSELNPLDEAAFLHERRAIHERLQGKVRPGKPKKYSANLAQYSFFDDTTQRFGLSRRTIERALIRFNNIDPAVRDFLRGTKWAKKGVDLDAIAKLEPAQQRRLTRILEEWSGDTTPSIAGAIRQLRGAKGLVDVDEEQFRRLIGAWRKAGAKARARFLDHLSDSDELAGQRGA